MFSTVFAMKIHRRLYLRQFLRFVETEANKTNKFLVEPLSERALIRVQGPEVLSFLQGLTTNDMNQLRVQKKPAMFSMFLNNSGRVLYDSLIYRTPKEDTFIIECDRGITNEFMRNLRLFRVRKKIAIESVDELTPWVIFNATNDGLPNAPEKKSEEILSTPDPRIKELGVRIIQPSGNTFEDIKAMFPNDTLEESHSSLYNVHRYVNGVGEGVIDHPPGKCFPLEANGDYLNGVSFQKGCYIGQELTARVHHTGVVRKRLMPLKMFKAFENKSLNVQVHNGASVGTVRGFRENTALALLRVEKVLKEEELLVDGYICKTYRPHWWPKEHSKEPSPRSD